MELMTPLDSLFLSAETREHPLHVGALQLFIPPADAGPTFVPDTHQVSYPIPIRQCCSATT